MHMAKDGLWSGEPLALDQWQPFLDRVTRAIEGAPVTVEISSLDYGHQRLAENVAIRGISFDPKNGLLEIGLDGLDHRIPHPRSLSVDVQPEGVNALQIVGDGGVRTIIHLKELLRLSEPESLVAQSPPTPEG